MSERIVIEYHTGGPGGTYQHTVAATVSSIEDFMEALNSAVNEVYEAKKGRHFGTLEVDGTALADFPVEDYLHEKGLVDVMDLDDWFEQNEMSNSSQDKLNRLSGVVGSSPI